MPQPEIFPFVRWWLDRYLSSAEPKKLTHAQRGIYHELFWLGYRSASRGGDGSIPDNREDLKFLIAAADGPPTTEDLEAVLRFYKPWKKNRLIHDTVREEVSARSRNHTDLSRRGAKGGRVAANNRKGKTVNKPGYSPATAGPKPGSSPGTAEPQPGRSPATATPQPGLSPATAGLKPNEAEVEKGEGRREKRSCSFISPEGLDLRESPSGSGPEDPVASDRKTETAPGTTPQSPREYMAWAEIQAGVLAGRPRHADAPWHSREALATLRGPDAGARRDRYFDRFGRNPEEPPPGWVNRNGKWEQLAAVQTSAPAHEEGR